MADFVNNLQEKIKELEKQVNEKNRIVNELKNELSETSKRNKRSIAINQKKYYEQIKKLEYQYKCTLFEQEKLLRSTWTWKVGRIFIASTVLLKNLILNPIKFLRFKDYRYKNIFYVINTEKADPSIKKSKVRAELLDIKYTKEIDPVEIDKDKLNVACIFDLFTQACFKPEMNIISFNPHNWRETFKRYPPDALFVESAWKGINNTWSYRIVDNQYDPEKELKKLILWANNNNLPSIFWNKEDPVHFERFKEAAKKFDFIFTTDENSIPGYQKLVNHNNIYPLPFAAQPYIHNPVQEEERIASVCFAGTYHASSHEDRKMDMEYLLKPALNYGLDIYDRMHGLKGKEARLWKFPVIYQSAIRGKLDYNEMVLAYKRYKVFLNINSIKNSPTMFARRVFELLACGTPVISNYSNAIVNILGEDTVFLSESENETRKHLEYLLYDEEAWLKASVKGIRKVMDAHTYFDRYKYILEKVNIENKKNKYKKFCIICPISEINQLNNLLDCISSQSYNKFDLIIISDIKRKDGIDLNEVSKRALPTTHTSVITLDSNNIAKQITINSNADYFAIFNPQDYYGPDYLKDYVHVSMYSDSLCFGKGSYFVAKTQDEVELEKKEYIFRLVNQVPNGSLVFNRGYIHKINFRELFITGFFRENEIQILSINPFDYLQNHSDTYSILEPNNNIISKITL